MIPESIQVCPQKVPILIKNISFTHRSNVVTINLQGFSVPEQIPGPISLHISCLKCDLRKSFCNNLPIKILPDYCVYLKSNDFGANFTNQIKPRFDCPLKPVSYIF